MHCPPHLKWPGDAELMQWLLHYLCQRKKGGRQQYGILPPFLELMGRKPCGTGAAAIGASRSALREGQAMTLFGAVLRGSSGRKSTRLYSVLGTELVYPVSLSLRASFTLSLDTCSYNNFCNSISEEEIGFTVHLISLFFFPENSAAWSFSLTLCGYFWFCFSRALRLNVFPFCLFAISSIVTENFVCSF